MDAKTRKGISFPIKRKGLARPDLWVHLLAILVETFVEAASAAFAILAELLVETISESHPLKYSHKHSSESTCGGIPKAAKEKLIKSIHIDIALTWHEFLMMHTLPIELLSHVAFQIHHSPETIPPFRYTKMYNIIEGIQILFSTSWQTTPGSTPETVIDVDVKLLLARSWNRSWNSKAILEKKN